MKKVNLRHKHTNVDLMYFKDEHKTMEN